MDCERDLNKAKMGLIFMLITKEKASIFKSSKVDETNNII